MWPIDFYNSVLFLLLYLRICDRELENNKKLKYIRWKTAVIKDGKRLPFIFCFLIFFFQLNKTSKEHKKLIANNDFP